MHLWSKLGLFSLLSLALFVAPQERTGNPEKALGVEKLKDTREDEQPVREDSETSADYLSTSLFVELLSKVDLGDGRKRELFERNLESQKGMLSFPEYCYLQGRLYFAKGDFSGAARLLAQVTSIKGFIKKYPDTYYYLTLSYSNLKKFDKAEAVLRMFRQEVPENDQLLQKAYNAFGEMAAPDSKAAKPEVHVFDAERRPLVSIASSQPGSTRMPSLRLGSSDIMLDELKGKLLLLHFWASWCAPCARELPSLVAFTKGGKFPRDIDLTPIFVTVDNFAGEGREFLARKSLIISNLYWDQDMIVLRSLTGSSLIPSTVIYDTQKRHVVKIFGQLEWQTKKVQDEVINSVATYLEGDPKQRGEVVH